MDTEPKDFAGLRAAVITFGPGLEFPEQLETLSMPPNDSFGFYDDQWLLPVAPETTKQIQKRRSFVRI